MVSPQEIQLASDRMHSKSSTSALIDTTSSQVLLKDPQYSLDHPAKSTTSTSDVDLEQAFLYRDESPCLCHKITQKSRRRWWNWYPSRKLLCILLGFSIFTFLGIIIWLALVTSFIRWLSHHSTPTNGVSRLINNITLSQSTLARLQSLQPFPDDFTRDITPIPCHSHNDYWRHVPLLGAISAGCTSVEADIMVSTGRSQAPNKSELYVGHMAGSLKPGRTFKSLYIDPLVYILDQTNDLPSADSLRASLSGIFEASSNTTMVLLVDFKESTSGTEIWSLFQNHLQPLREKGYLTYWNATKNERIMGPVTVVVTGVAPFDHITNSSTNAHQDIFFDAPLLDLGTDIMSLAPEYNISNSYYASVDLTKAVGKVWLSLTKSQQAKIEKQSAIASDLGLLGRYWDTPSWPVSVRNKVWEQLIQNGVSVLNVDQLWTASKEDWRFCSAVGWGICP